MKLLFRNALIEAYLFFFISFCENVIRLVSNDKRFLYAMVDGILIQLL